MPRSHQRNTCLGPAPIRWLCSLASEFGPVWVEAHLFVSRSLYPTRIRRTTSPVHACAGCDHEHAEDCSDAQHDHSHSRRQTHAHAGPSDADAEAALQRQRLLFGSFGQVLRSKVRALCCPGRWATDLIAPVNVGVVTSPVRCR